MAQAERTVSSRQVERRKLDSSARLGGFSKLDDITDDIFSSIMQLHGYTSVTRGSTTLE
jgi:hypothetical protein